MHLSVIIPTLDRLETARLIAGRIRELLPSLGVEVIVVTPQVEHQAAGDFVRYVIDSRRGVYGAYKLGLREARGEYVWFIGDDDYPLDGASAIGAVLEEGAIDLLIAPVLLSTGKLYRPTRSLLLLHFLNWCQQGVVYRRRTLLRHRFFRRLTVQADQYVNILLRSDAAISRTFLAEPICMFGVNGVSGRLRDAGYRLLRSALAHRTLSWGAFLVFRLLVIVEPVAKRMIRVR